MRILSIANSTHSIGITTILAVYNFVSSEQSWMENQIDFLSPVVLLLLLRPALPPNKRKLSQSERERENTRVRERTKPNIENRV